MKILKIFGIVAGIHVFALILIFANPGCSSTTKTTPAPSDTITQSQPPASTTVTLPNPPSPAASATSEPITFNPDAPAVASNSSGGVRFTPTRPGSPAATTLIVEPVVDVTPATTYTVVSGDNLWNLAKRHHVSVTELAATNNISASTVLRPGQKLIIPGKPASPTAAATANPAASGGETARTVAVKPSSGAALTHVVKAGETLGIIARRYGVKQGDIAVANNISDPQKILAGTELIIPGWQSPGAGKSGKAGAKSSESAAKSSSGKSGESRPAFKVEDEQNAPKPPVPPAEVPVIRVDDSPSPISPAPRN
ncbi:MAG: LysM peptidoglycan-binding domain-containing protein [Opitutaceae bacterium]|nr:LysM peptidoglycan-binding domain-containing protein [Opitutaceae bacterium]